MTAQCRKLNRSLTVQINTRSIDGDVSDTWASTTTNCKAELVFSGGKEDFEEIGGVYKERRRYRIRKENRTWQPQKTRFKESTDTDFFYMTAFHPYKGSKEYYTIEGIQRDDE